MRPNMLILVLHDRLGQGLKYTDTSVTAYVSLCCSAQVWQVMQLKIWARILSEHRACKLAGQVLTPWSSNGAQDAYQTANTALLFHSGRLMALQEQDLPYRVRLHAVA